MTNKDKYTVKAAEAIRGAFEIAAGRGNPEATPSHLLLALMRQEDGIAGRLLAKVGVHTPNLEAAALADLEAKAGKGQAPCLVVGNRAMHEAADIMKYFAERTTDIGG